MIKTQKYGKCYHFQKKKKKTLLKLAISDVVFDTSASKFIPSNFILILIKVLLS